MLTCFCGNILFSDGKLWSCPMKGEKMSCDKDGLHKGVVIIDRRTTVKDKR